MNGLGLCTPILSLPEGYAMFAFLQPYSPLLFLSQRPVQYPTLNP